MRGLPSRKRKKGPGPGPLRAMNARTAATGHKSLSVLPMKISAPTLKGSVGLGCLYPDTNDLGVLGAVH